MGRLKQRLLGFGVRMGTFLKLLEDNDTPYNQPTSVIGHYVKEFVRVYDIIT